MVRVSALIAALLITLFSLGSANANDFRVNELRFGGSWVNPDVFGSHLFEPDQSGINAEILFTPFDFDHRDNPSDGFIHQLLTPRLHVGGLLNLDSPGVSSFYSGFTWRINLTDRFFIEPTFGGVIHDGRLNRPTAGPRTRSEFGSRILFRESIAIGVNISENMTLILQSAHMSHAELAGDDNAGQTDFNLKVGIKF